MAFSVKKACNFARVTYFADINGNCNGKSARMGRHFRLFTASVGIILVFGQMNIAISSVGFAGRYL
jgi:hypothetical protein